MKYPVETNEETKPRTGASKWRESHCSGCVEEYGVFSAGHQVERLIRESGEEWNGRRSGIVNVFP